MLGVIASVDQLATNNLSLFWMIALAVCLAGAIVSVLNIYAGWFDPVDILASLIARTAEMRIVSPSEGDLVSTSVVRVAGSSTFRPDGDWVLMTRKGNSYWPQGNIVFSADGRSWYCDVDLGRGKAAATVVVAAIDPGFRQLVDYFSRVGLERNQWTPITLANPIGMKVVAQATIHRELHAA